jgi:NAD(P)-dependent dehydrogenase (short-subunit alcohol dehydrogenase family)
MKRPKEKDVKEVGPCIIHVSSFRAYVSDPNQEGYTSTKARELGLTQSMAITCQKWDIRVNAGRIKVAHECKEGDAKGLK